MSPAYAVTAVDRYGNTDCANNGDGTASTCAASGGAAGAYNNLGNALSDITSDYPNFNTSDVAVTLHMKGATADTTDPDMSGIIAPNATHDFKMVVDPTDRHDGKWNTGKYRLVNGGYYGVIAARLQFLTVDGFQLESNTNDNDAKGTGVVIRPEAEGGTIKVLNCLYRKTGTSTNSGNRGIDFNLSESTGGTKLIAVNNIIYGPTNGSGIYCSTSVSDTCIVYNNTVVNAGGSGIELLFYGSNDTIYVKNNLIQYSTNPDYYSESTATSFTSANNVTEDTSSPDGGTYQSKSATFVNSASKDFHLASGDTAAKDVGVDLSADGQFSFTTDIDNDTRTGTWDVGADEFISGGGGSVVPAIVGAKRVQGRFP